MGLVAVRRLLRGLPGQDRHSVRVASPARGCGARVQDPALARGAGDGGGRPCVRLTAPLRAGSEARTAGSWADRDGCAAGLVGDARPPGGARADLPGVVALAPAATQWRRAGAVSGGREAVLARVRAALGPAPEMPEVPRAYRQAGALGPGGDPVTVDLFCDRVADYKATVRRVSDEKLADALRAACEQREARRIAVPTRRRGRCRA